MNAKQRKVNGSNGKKQWVVIASQAETKIFEKTMGPKPNLKAVIKFESPEARSYNRTLMRHEIGSGISGGNQKGVGSRRYGLSSSSKSPREGASERFAKKIVRYLVSQHEAGKFQNLVLAAEPHFMGKMRKPLLGSIPSITFLKKDFCKTPLRDLEGRLGTLK